MIKILVPTDFSENAFNAISYALELFKYRRAIFYFMHAYSDEVYNHEALKDRSNFEKVKDQVRQLCESQLTECLEKVNALSPNPKHEYKKVLSFNSLIDEADKIVERENVDILVMGTRGMTDDRSLTFGSNTLQVIRYVKCPVLSIPAKYGYQRPEDVLFATNYMIPYKRRELKLLSETMNSFRAQIEVVYISKSDSLLIRQEDNRDFIKVALEQNHTKFNTIINDNIVDAILDRINTNNIDLLVMVNTRHSFLEYLLYSSTIDKINLNLKIPFLALQNINRS